MAQIFSMLAVSDRGNRLLPKKKHLARPRVFPQPRACQAKNNPAPL